MTKRAIRFGVYDTALYGWTLAACVLSDAEQKTKFVEKTCGDGAWNLSTVMTDGIPRYNTRTLTATLECSEGTRDERQELISDIVNQLDGLEHKIVLPDYPSHYLVGLVHVAVDYNDMAHASVTITATCQPWLYREAETVVTLAARSTEQTATLRNSGRLVVVPTITITGDAADVTLKYGNYSMAMSAGTYTWTTLVLTPGNHDLTYSGTGEITITYREAVLR